MSSPAQKLNSFRNEFRVGTAAMPTVNPPGGSVLTEWTAALSRPIGARGAQRSIGPSNTRATTGK